jgi:hypothetical protein
LATSILVGAFFFLFVALFDGPLKQKALTVGTAARVGVSVRYVAYTTRELRYMLSTVSHLCATR